MADNYSSPPQGDARSLAHQINVAIASSHTKINRLILDRMPRAVPPQTDNPSAYITGLLHIGAVYVAFESLWQNILAIHSDIAPIPYTYPFSHDPRQRDDAPQITQRTRHILEQAYWPVLLRSARIKADIRSMTGWPDHVIDEQIRSVGTSGRLGKFTLHIHESVTAKPHLLLAYAYSLYLALLSGGTYIRTELMYLKSDFWHATPTPIRPNMIECIPKPDLEKSKRHDTSGYDPSSHGLARHDPTINIPLEFLDFDPPLGENPRQQAKNLKAEFKRRFAEAEQSLAEPERHDIIKESTAIFNNLESMVGQLDNTCGTSQTKGQVQRALHPPAAHSLGTANLSTRLRDSIAIAKGRLWRTTRKSSDGSSVTATVPTALGDLTDSQASSSPQPSSMSRSSGEGKGAWPEPGPQEQTDLAHDAVVPAGGFRMVRYGSDLPRPDRTSLKSYDEKGGNPHGFDGASFDSIRADVERCPISRVPRTKEVTPIRKEGPNYALYAIISNFVVLLGIAIVFAAYLYVRHEETRTMPVDL